MNSAKQVWVAATAGVILLSAVCALAQAPAGDWPQWRGPNRDGKTKTFVVPETWPKELTQVWKLNVGGGDDASPAVVGGKLYVVARQGSEEVTMCLNAADGTKIWEKKNPVPAVTGPAAGHAGPRSSPAVADGKVVTLSVHGVLSCFKADNGDQLWRNEEYAGKTPRFLTSSSPLIADGMAIAQLGGPDQGVIGAYDLATGEKKWEYATDAPDYASPALMTVDGTKQVVALTTKNVVGVALADGKLLWEMPFAAQGRSYNAVTPVVDGATVYVTAQGRGTTALKIEKKDDKFVAAELWKNAAVGAQYNTPVLKDGLLFGLSEQKKLYCQDAKTGEVKWTDTANYSTYGSIVDTGTALVALVEGGSLIVYKPSGVKYEELAKYKLTDAKVYAHLVLSGDRIIVQDQQAVMVHTAKPMPATAPKSE